MWVFDGWPKSGLFQQAVAVVFIFSAIALEGASAPKSLSLALWGFGLGMIVELGFRNRIDGIVTGDLTGWSNALKLNAGSTIRLAIWAILFAVAPVLSMSAAALLLLVFVAWIGSVFAIVFVDARRHIARNEGKKADV